jgi:hypothetical protein
MITRRTHHMPTLEECTANILEVFRSCTDLECETWRNWYTDAHEWALDLAITTGHSVEVVAHVAAAMSPRIRWSLAQNATENLLRNEAVTIGFVSSRTKAIACMNGNLDALRGPKVVPFAELIINPYLADKVVIDSWAIQVALGDPSVDSNAYANNPARLKTFRLAYQTAAVLVANSTSGVMGHCSCSRSSTFRDSVVTITPAELQAITWCKVNPDYEIQLDS